MVDQSAAEPSQDQTTLEKRATSCEWAARRNLLMALVSAAAWVAITAAIVWVSMVRAQADRDEKIRNSADSIRTQYVKMLETLKPDLVALDLPKQADNEIAALKKLTPVEISGYDLGTQLFPAVLEALPNYPLLVPKWMATLKRLQIPIKPIEASKVELAKAIGAAQEAALSVEITPLIVLLSVMAFAICCPLMSFFGIHAQRFSELSSLYRALGEATLLFEDDERHVRRIRNSLVNRITKLEDTRIDPVKAALQMFKAIPDFLKSFKLRD